jgi:hypothetical protein
MIPAAIVAMGVAFSVLGWLSHRKEPHHAWVRAARRAAKLMAGLEEAFWDVEFAMHEAEMIVAKFGRTWWRTD